jgi:adenylate cyclase
VPLADDARSTGEGVVRALRLGLAERAAAALSSRPELVGTAVEVGLVDRDWLEEPGRRPVSTTAPLDVVVRFLERSAERQPSFLAQVGLNAIQLLSWRSEEGAPADARTAQPVAVVFTDLEGFTAFTARRGDEAASTLLAEHHRAAGPIVRSRGGRVVKRLGDGLMLAFPDAAAAVHAAVELQGSAPAPLRLRAGVHWGEAVVTRDDLIGHAVNLAARVTEDAKGGQVLVTGPTVEAAGELRGIRFGRARRRSFKGVGEAVSVRTATVEG